MNVQIKRAYAPAIALAALSACSGGARHDSASLPSVADVQQRFVDAVGGRKAIMRPRTMTLRSKVSLGSASVGYGASAVVYAGNFKRLQVVTVPGRGRYLSGYDDHVAWALSPRQPPQIVKGRDAASFRRDADMYYSARIPSYFRTMKVVGVEDFAGHRCYHLRGTTLWGNENNQYYDVNDGLLVGYRFHQWIRGAPEKVESRQIFEDYKNFDGLYLPTRETDIRGGKMVAVTQLVAVKYDNVNPHVFTPPPAVRKLI